MDAALGARIAEELEQNKRARAQSLESGLPRRRAQDVNLIDIRSATNSPYVRTDCCGGVLHPPHLFAAFASRRPN